MFLAKFKVRFSRKGLNIYIVTNFSDTGILFVLLPLIVGIRD